MAASRMGLLVDIENRWVVIGLPQLTGSLEHVSET